MLEAILSVFIFIIGIYFGSFFTLATYRLPKGENITHKHSYCPSCNHKLGVLDLVPLFSYLFLGGKCRYCKQKIGIRYFLFELLTGIVFVLFYISLKLNIYTLKVSKLIYFGVMILYFAYIFLTAGIDKEQNKIMMNVTFFGIFISIAYMIYSYTLGKINVYEYIIYLLFIAVLLFINSIILKKMKSNSIVQLIIFFANMLIVSGLNVMILTIILTILSIGIKNIAKYFKKEQKINEKQKTPIAFFLGVSNIIVIIMVNFIMNYKI